MNNSNLPGGAGKARLVIGAVAVLGVAAVLAGRARHEPAAAALTARAALALAPRAPLPPQGQPVVHAQGGPGGGASQGASADTIVYHMHRVGHFAFDEEDWEVRGTFERAPGPAGTFTLHGAGTLQGHTTSSRYATTNRCQGSSEIRGGGGPGDLLWVGGSAVGGECVYTVQGKAQQRDVGAADTGFRCDFSAVDLARSGTYTVHADGEESQWALCTLQLKAVAE